MSRRSTTLNVTGVLLVACLGIGVDALGVGIHHVGPASVGYVQGRAVAEDLAHPNGIDAARCRTLFDQGVRVGAISQAFITGTQELDWMDGCQGKTP